MVGVQSRDGPGMRRGRPSLFHQNETHYLLASLTTRIPKLAELGFSISYFEVSGERKTKGKSPLSQALIELLNKLRSNALCSVLW